MAFWCVFFPLLVSGDPSGEVILGKAGLGKEVRIARSCLFDINKRKSNVPVTPDNRLWLGHRDHTQAEHEMKFNTNLDMFQIQNVEFQNFPIHPLGQHSLAIAFPLCLIQMLTGSPASFCLSSDPAPGATPRRLSKVSDPSPKRRNIQQGEGKIFKEERPLPHLFCTHCRARGDGKGGIASGVCTCVIINKTFVRFSLIVCWLPFLIDLWIQPLVVSKVSLFTSPSLVADTDPGISLLLNSWQ